jgi:hypothetical protein
VGAGGFIVLRASYQELKSALNFPSVSYSIRNFDKPIALLATWFHADFFIGLFFDPEDGGHMFLRNVC